MSEGLNIRGKNVTVHQNNPFTTSPNTVSVKVCDIPLSVHDNKILTTLRNMGAEVIGECKREKLRINGKLVNCTTGNRLMTIKTPKEPLPRFVNISDFKAKIFHAGQPNNKDLVCSNCQEKGHTRIVCRNKTKCSVCFKVDQHVTSDCPESRRPKGIPSTVDIDKNQSGKSNDMNESHEEEFEESGTQQSPSILTGHNEQVVINRRPMKQSILKLSAGKLEFTPAPEEDDSDNRSSESTVSEDEIYEHEDSEHDENDMSAVTPSPGHCGEKRKQKVNKDLRQKRRHRGPRSKGRRK